MNAEITSAEVQYRNGQPGNPVPCEGCGQPTCYIDRRDDVVRWHCTACHLRAFNRVNQSSEAGNGESQAQP